MLWVEVEQLVIDDLQVLRKKANDCEQFFSLQLWTVIAKSIARSAASSAFSHQIWLFLKDNCGMKV